MAKRRKVKPSVKFIFALIIFCFVVFYLKNHFLNRDGIVEIKSVDKIYLALNERKIINLDIVSRNEGNKNLTYKVNDESIVSVNKFGELHAKSIGTTKLMVSSVSGKLKNIEVIVTDLITLPTYSQEKENLSCKKYSNDEAKVLDDILKNSIQNAGYGTRAGVVEAARFLSLNFPYKINYFFENGRLNDETREHVDGEGRYYHDGLYLSEDKYDLLEASTNTPVMWGCDLYANYVKTYSRNGLNCSGFVSWAMLNGGFDVGDLGAGITDQYDFTDIGEKHNITLDLLNSNKIKVGDLIGRNGHIAIIIGLDEYKIYIAESYMPSMKVREFTYEELVNSDDFKYVMLMDSVYKNDGNLTNMW